MGAGEACQNIQSREWFTSHMFDLVFGEVDVEGHITLQLVAPMSDSLHGASMCFDCVCNFDFVFAIKFRRLGDLDDGSESLSSS